MPHLLLKIRSEELREHRFALMLSPEELGERAGVSGDAIRKLERSDGGVRLGTVRKLADALGCDPYDIAERVDQEVAS